MHSPGKGMSHVGFSMVGVGLRSQGCALGLGCLPADRQEAVASCTCFPVEPELLFTAANSRRWVYGGNLPLLSSVWSTLTR